MAVTRLPVADPEVTPQSLHAEAAAEADAYSFQLLTQKGLRFPWTAVDRIIGTPLLPGWFVLIGGRAKAGKSLLLRTLFHAWTSLGRKVMYVGTEQAAHILRLLLAAERLGVSVDAVLDPEHPDHLRVLADVCEGQRLIAENAVVVAEADLTVERFKYWCRLAYKWQFDAVLLDHFHRVQMGNATGGPSGRDQWQSRGDAATQIKNVADLSGMLIVAAAQLKHGEGGALLGEYEIPGPGSWAETAGLRREADVAIQAWKPLRPRLKAADKRAAKDDPAKLAEIIQPNVMALRVDAHRYNHRADGSVFARLRVVNGALHTWTPDPNEPPELGI